MEGQMPEWIRSGLKRISRQQWAAFAGVWAVGLFAHGYMILNKLPNHDDIACFWSKGAGAQSGRWALDLMAQLDGGFSSPWMLGLFSILLISLSAMLLVGLLRLSSPLFCGLAGAVLAAFPSVICTFAYMFTSDAYMLSFLLAVLCVWFSKKGGWQRAAAVACLVVSLGLYQAYLGWAVALMIYSLLLRCLNDDAGFKRIFLDGVWDVGVLAAGTAGYLGVTRLVWAVSGDGPVGYQGIDHMGQIDLQALPGQIKNAYALVLNTFRDSCAGACTSFRLRLLLTGCLWLAVLLIGLRILRQFLMGRRLEALLAVFLVLILPAGIGIVCMMGIGYIHTLMIYPMCMIPLAFLSQCEGWNAQLPECKETLKKHIHTFGRWVCAGLVALLASQYAFQANEVYLCLQLNHTRRVAYWTGIVTQIKSLPNYDQWMPVVLITEDGWDRSTPRIWHDMDHVNDLIGVRMPMHVYSDAAFLQLYLGFSTEFPDPAGYTELPEVQEMPTYPLDGSIRMIDGEIIVKF